MEKKRVIAVKKNSDGDITDFQFNTGEIVDYKAAIKMAKNDEIEHANAFKGRDGEFHIRSDADDDPKNNFDNMPTFD